jgi:uncharacterized membrane protein
MRKLLFLWKELKATFWFVPVLLILVSVVLAMGLVFLDSRLEVRATGFGRYLLTGSPASARNILTTISGAMIGLAGTVFSITLVVLTIAASQFGSRLIRNFMYIRLNQLVLGSYISTYLYCLIVLNAIRENEEIVFVPSLSVLLALLLAVFNIGLLILFIHQVAVSIQASAVIAGISTSLTKTIKSHFTKEIEEEKEENRSEEDEESIKAGFSHKRSLKADRNGYVRYIDYGSLKTYVIEQGFLVELYYRTGDYLVKDMKIGVVYSNEKIESEAIQALLNRFIIGKNRTSHQDAEFAIHQMVEIAARALSPGVNDPYTANACIDNLTSVMAYLATVEFPHRYRYDDEGSLRIIADILTYQGMLDAAFNQIRQYAKGNPSVIIKLMESLIILYEIARRWSYKQAIKKHAQLVLNAARHSFEEENDLQDLEKRSKMILGEE